MKELMARVVGEADVYPGVVLFVDELVEGEVQFLDEVEETAVLLGMCGSGRRGAFDVGSLSAHVLAVLCATDSAVEFRRTVAAVHDDRFSVGVA